MAEKNLLPLQLKLINAAILLVLIMFALSILWLLIDLWPNKFGIGNDFWGYKLNIEKRIILLVILGGGLGAFIHTATSFTDFLGNRALKYSWLPWYLMRPFIGGALALVVYLLLRGGLFNPSFDNSTAYNEYTFEIVNSDSLQNEYDHLVSLLQEDTVYTPAQKDSVLFAKKQQLTAIQNANREIPPVNPFGIVAISCLAGMFSRQAIDKLKEVFESLFSVRVAVDRKDKIDDTVSS